MIVHAGSRAATPVGSYPNFLSWGASYGSQSYCRACYDFTRRYGRGQCEGIDPGGHCGQERQGCRGGAAVQAPLAASGTDAAYRPEISSAAGYWRTVPEKRVRTSRARTWAFIRWPARKAAAAPRRTVPPRRASMCRCWDRGRHSRAEAGGSLHLIRTTLSRPGDHRSGTCSRTGTCRRPGGRLRLERPDHHRTSRALAAVLAGRRPGVMIAWPAPGGPAQPGPQHHPHRQFLALAGQLDDDRIPIPSPP